MSNPTTERFVTEYTRRFGSRGDGVSDAMAEIRDRAIERFAETGIPAKSEAWKYTNVANLLSRGLETALGEIEDGAQIPLPADAEWLAVCVNGRFSTELSRLPDEKGIVVNSLGHAVAVDPSIAIDYLGQYADPNEEALVALNAAFSTDGVYVRVETGINVETPLHVVNLVTGEKPLIAQARHLFVLGESSHLTIIEHDSTRVSAARCFTNTVVEVHVGPNAVLEHYRLQEKNGADHVDSTYVRQDENSEYRSCVVSIGDGVVRNNLAVTVAGEHSHTKLRGLALADGEGHIDNFTLVEHAVPNCRSDELYKSILGGRAQSVFRGKLFVKEHAQKTAAFQSNRNLLLSPDAIANALPQLEIYADDVKCSHGATTGLLDQEALFYLRSRGISRATARKMLIEAFVDEVIADVDDKAVASRIHSILDSFLESIEL